MTGQSSRGLIRERLAGQGFVEAAIVLPVLVLILFLAVGGAELFRAQMTAEAASAEGARYATLHPDASVEEVTSWVRDSVDVEDCSVVVTTTELPDQGYTLVITDADGTVRSTEARNIRTAITVRVDIGYGILGLDTPYVASSAHTGIVSDEGVA